MGIIELLGERAATTSELAAALDRPKGTIGHHCKALQHAGLIHVVRTERMRAIEAKHYGRTARTFVLCRVDGMGHSAESMLSEAATEMTRFRNALPEEETPGITSIRYARIPHDRASEWEKRLDRLITDFTGQPRAGERVFGLVVALFPTIKPTLPDSGKP